MANRINLRRCVTKSPASFWSRRIKTELGIRACTSLSPPPPNFSLFYFSVSLSFFLPPPPPLSVVHNLFNFFYRRCMLFVSREKSGILNINSPIFLVYTCEKTSNQNLDKELIVFKERRGAQKDKNLPLDLIWFDLFYLKKGVSLIQG